MRLELGRVVVQGELKEVHEPIGIQFAKVAKHGLWVFGPEDDGVHVFGAEGDLRDLFGVEWIGHETEALSDSVHEPVRIECGNIRAPARRDDHDPSSMTNFRTVENRVKTDVNRG